MRALPMLRNYDVGKGANVVTQVPNFSQLVPTFLRVSIPFNLQILSLSSVQFLSPF